MRFDIRFKIERGSKLFQVQVTSAAPLLCSVFNELVSSFWDRLKWTWIRPLVWNNAPYLCWSPKSFFVQRPECLNKWHSTHFLRQRLQPQQDSTAFLAVQLLSSAGGSAWGHWGQGTSIGYPCIEGRQWKPPPQCFLLQQFGLLCSTAQREGLPACRRKDGLRLHWIWQEGSTVEQPQFDLMFLGMGFCGKRLRGLH